LTEGIILEDNTVQGETDDFIVEHGKTER